MLSLLRLHKVFFFKNLSGPDNRFLFLIGKLRALNRLSFLLYGPRSGFFFSAYQSWQRGTKNSGPKKMSCSRAFLEIFDLAPAACLHSASPTLCPFFISRYPPSHTIPVELRGWRKCPYPSQEGKCSGS